MQLIPEDIRTKVHSCSYNQRFIFEVIFQMMRYNMHFIVLLRIHKCNPSAVSTIVKNDSDTFSVLWELIAKTTYRARL